MVIMATWCMGIAGAPDSRSCFHPGPQVQFEEAGMAMQGLGHRTLAEGFNEEQWGGGGVVLDPPPQAWQHNFLYFIRESLID